MNKEQQELLDEAYEKALMKYGFNWLPGTPPGTVIETQEIFINKCKTNTEFSESWGLKIVERELDMFERWKLADLTPNMMEIDWCNKLCDEHNVPTRLITVTYNDKAITSYE